MAYNKRYISVFNKIARLTPLIAVIIARFIAD